MCIEVPLVLLRCIYSPKNFFFFFRLEKNGSISLPLFSKIYKISAQWYCTLLFLVRVFARVKQFFHLGSPVLPKLITEARRMTQEDINFKTLFRIIGGGRTYLRPRKYNDNMRTRALGRQIF